VTNLADLCLDLPIAALEPGDVLLSEGDRSGRLYVLVEGSVEVLKGDFQINLVSDEGAVFGEMSVLQDQPHMATVRALTPCRVRVSDRGEDFLRSHPDIAYLLAQTLAQRLHGVTTYLVDLKRQFESEESHLGVVDTILESLVHEQRSSFTPGSDRDPGY
jgi:CRP-like cAMP-binding protein